jgi:hypothetical protein
LAIRAMSIQADAFENEMQSLADDASDVSLSEVSQQSDDGREPTSFLTPIKDSIQPSSSISSGGQQYQAFGSAWTTLPDEVFTLSFFVTARGMQCVQIYLCILTDISWMQGYYVMGDVFGTAAVMVALSFVLRSIFLRNYDDMFIGIAHSLWQIGNFVWMTGELHDIQYPERKSLYSERAELSTLILQIALIYSGIYFFIIKPFNCVRVNRVTIQKQYDDGKIPSRMTCFKRFRDYERMHLFFW